jgi:hypothetical protein
MDGAAIPLLALVVEMETHLPANEAAFVGWGGVAFVVQ